MNKPLAEMTVAELTIAARETDNRQLSLAMTRMAAAKEALAVGDRESARKYLEAAKTAWLRSQEDEQGQLARVAATQAVAVERDAALDASKLGGKHVVRLAIGRKGAVWQDNWVVG